MTTGQLIAIVLAIFGSSGLWHLIEARLSRKDEVDDRKHKSIEEFEENLDRCSDACKKLLAYILMPWQEDVMNREKQVIGVYEYEVMTGLAKVYTELGGNGTVKNRQDYINTLTKIPDTDWSESEWRN